MMIIVVLICLAAVATAEALRGRLCIGHPVLKLQELTEPLLEPDFRPEIIRSWDFHPIRTNHLHWKNSFYQPRDERHKYIPITDVEVAKGKKTLCSFDTKSKSEIKRDKRFIGLDVFVTDFDGQDREDWARLHFQRNALVYLFVDGHRRDFKDLKKATLRGWKPVGWVMETSGNYAKAIPFGVEQADQPIRFKKHLGRLCYVFSNEEKISDTVQIPSSKWLKNNIKGIKTWGAFHVRVAEESGEAIKKPVSPKGWDYIPAGGRCPERLHDLWRTPGDKTDEHRPEFAKNGFRTFHPLFDPCYFCAYDHEHGSDPHILMGYDPKFGYTAMKNYDQDESHAGFKGHVLELEDDMFLYYQVHAKCSDMRRYSARHHTMVIAVTKKITEGDQTRFDLLAELSFKADFGFAAGKKPKGGALGLREEDIKMQKSGMRALRQMNVWDEASPDKSFRKRTNEHWFMGKSMLCMYAEGRRLGKLEIRDPSTATRERNVKERVWLGKKDKSGNYLFRRTATNRDVTLKKVHIGQRYCGPWYLPEVRGYGQGSTFYTNPNATQLVIGPGKYAIKQYMHENVDIFVNGKFKAVDTWLGLMRKNYQGHMHNIGNAINPEVN